MEPKRINGKWGYNFMYQGRRYRKQGLHTKKEAQTLIKEILTSNIEVDMKARNTLFSEYFEHWVETYKAKNVTTKTYQRYFRAQKDLMQFAGTDLRMRDLTQSDYQKFLNFLAEHYAKGTIDKRHQSIKACFNQAVYDGIVDRNPTFNAIITSEVDDMPEHVKFMEDYEYLKLLDLFIEGGTRKHLLLYLLHITGARFGEINTLYLSNFNFKDETLRIDGTKTDNALRVIDISPIHIQYIKRQLSEMDIDVSRPLFDFSHTVVYRSFKRALRQAGISDDKIMHSLRHTHITYLVDQGVDIEYVSKRVGHASVNITREFYGHKFKSAVTKEKVKTKDVMDAMKGPVHQ